MPLTVQYMAASRNMKALVGLGERSWKGNTKVLLATTRRWLVLHLQQQQPLVRPRLPSKVVREEQGEQDGGGSMAWLCSLLRSCCVEVYRGYHARQLLHCQQPHTQRRVGGECVCCCQWQRCDSSCTTCSTQQSLPGSAKPHKRDVPVE